jgi:hypothetical protein
VESRNCLAKENVASYVATMNYCDKNAQPSVPVLRQIAEVLDVGELLVSTKG